MIFPQPSNLTHLFLQHLFPVDHWVLIIFELKRIKMRQQIIYGYGGNTYLSLCYTTFSAMKIATKSPEETKEFAIDFAKSLKAGDIICLYGDLGAGKTTFVQGLAKGLGIDKRIISPTFTIIREYPIENSKFYHIDLYRLKDVINLGLEEVLSSRQNILAIEWPEIAENILPKNRIQIMFKYAMGTPLEREITIKS